MSKHDRRSYFRVMESLPISLTIRDPETKKQNSFNGVAIDIGLTGLSISTRELLPKSDKGIIEARLPGPFEAIKARIKIKWRNDEKCYYGVEFTNSSENALSDWQKYIKDFSSSIPDRRQKEIHRRSINKVRPNGTGNGNGNGNVSSEYLINQEKRKTLRRFSDVLTVQESDDNFKKPPIKRSDLIPSQKGNDYSIEAAAERREWLHLKTGTKFKHINFFSENPQNMRGNIENFIGVAQVPIGIAGPLKINGDHAKDTYYIPMATTEGVIVFSYTLGMTILTQSGGVTTRVLSDEMHISPVFQFDTINMAFRFVEWVESNFLIIKREAEKTTKYGKLIKIEPIMLNRHVLLKFCYQTGDAMGMNMINIATERACKFITSAVKPEKFYIRSNFSSDKKMTAYNYTYGKGKKVIAEAVISRKQIERFNTTPEEMETYYKTVLFTSSHAGMLGMNAQVANTIAALFIAFGQDVANVANSFVGNTTYEVTKNGDLYVSVNLPSLILGTVGGGTNLGSQNECLKMVGCDGDGKARKLAEIVAATALAGELAIGISITNGTFVSAHLMFGRKGSPLQ